MFFNKKYIKVNHNEEPEKTQAEEPKQEEVKETAPVVETVTCKICKKELDKQRVIKNKYVCYECGYYFRVRTKNRIRMVADAGTFETWDNDLKTGNRRKSCHNTGKNRIKRRRNYGKLYNQRREDSSRCD